MPMADVQLSGCKIRGKGQVTARGCRAPQGLRQLLDHPCTRPLLKDPVRGGAARGRAVYGALQQGAEQSTKRPNKGQRRLQSASEWGSDARKAPGREAVTKVVPGGGPQWKMDRPEYEAHT